MRLKEKTYAIALGCILFGTGLVGCAPDEPKPSLNGGESDDETGGVSSLDGKEEELRRGRSRCRIDEDCPPSRAACRQCDDGSAACPEVSCVRNRCEYEFPACEDPYAPCSEKACGSQCRVCAPDDPDCFETAVVKFCQEDGSCSPLRPSCLDQNPCAVTLCPVGTECVVLESFPPQARCVPIEPDLCANVRCRAGTHCEKGMCIPDVPKQFCGGIAGFPCPGAGECVDDPSDDCDVNNGGADCGGMCLCNAIGLCIAGQHWDDSPSVCACVPDKAGGGKKCGENTCGKDEFCCNASCGICAPRGGACIQIACEETVN